MFVFGLLILYLYKCKDSASIHLSAKPFYGCWVVQVMGPMTENRGSSFGPWMPLTVWWSPQSLSQSSVFKCANENIKCYKGNQWCLNTVIKRILGGSVSWPSSSGFWLRSWSQAHGIQPCIRLRVEREMCLRFSLSLSLSFSPHLSNQINT